MWHQHPADIDPRLQRPRRARWFYWALETYALQDDLKPRTPTPKADAN